MIAYTASQVFEAGFGLGVLLGMAFAFFLVWLRGYDD